MTNAQVMTENGTIIMRALYCVSISNLEVHGEGEGGGGGERHCQAK